MPFVTYALLESRTSSTARSVYGSLTVMLALLYFGPQVLLRGLISQYNVFNVISTLIVAALF